MVQPKHSSYRDSIERFIRRASIGCAYRRKDFCQALGLPSPQKYEADQGPGLPDLARVLRGSVALDDDLATLLRAQLLFWMLAAIDGHAKNFSIRLLAGGRYRLTPLYDVISAWPLAGSRSDQVHPKKLALAMALRGKGEHHRIGEITRRHFNMTARMCGFGKDMESIVANMISATPQVIDLANSRRISRRIYSRVPKNGSIQCRPRRFAAAP